MAAQEQLISGVDFDVGRGFGLASEDHSSLFVSRLQSVFDGHGYLAGKQLHPTSSAGTDAAGVVVAFIALIWWSWRRDRIAAFGLLWFAIGLLPTLDIVPVAVPILERTTEPYRRALWRLDAVDFDPSLEPRAAQFRLDLRAMAAALKARVAWLSRHPAAAEALVTAPTRAAVWSLDGKHVCLVGHAPTLAERVRRLLGVEAPETFKMPKGGLACLETENRRTAALKFFITPKVLGVRED